MVPKESGFNQSETDPADRNVFQARLTWQEMVKLNKGSIFVDTMCHPFQTQVM